MKKSFIRPLALSLTATLLLSIACEQPGPIIPTQEKDSTLVVEKKEVIDNIFVDEKIQSALTPQLVLEIMKMRNQDFVNGNLTIRNNTDRLEAGLSGQYPGAVVLSCLDSRVPVEDVFHSGIGDIFVARVAGNIINEDMLGSLEYGCKVSNAKLILVLGHEDCGAIKSAVDHVELGNITPLLKKIDPAIEDMKNYEGERSSRNPQYLDAVTKQNVMNTIKEIRKKSPILKEMEEKGEIMIVGGMYALANGEVHFF